MWFDSLFELEKKPIHNTRSDERSMGNKCWVRAAYMIKGLEGRTDPESKDDADEQCPAYAVMNQVLKRESHHFFPASYCS